MLKQRPFSNPPKTRFFLLHVWGCNACCVPCSLNQGDIRQVPSRVFGWAVNIGDYYYPLILGSIILQIFGGLVYTKNIFVLNRDKGFRWVLSFVDMNIELMSYTRNRLRAALESLHDVAWMEKMKREKLFGTRGASVEKMGVWDCFVGRIHDKDWLVTSWKFYWWVFFPKN